MNNDQKFVFLESEGDAWYERNIENQNNIFDPQQDRIIPELLQLPLEPGMKILEIGCSNGLRLKWIKDNLELQCYGIEPSKKAVQSATSQDLKVIQGTADSLLFEDDLFDLVIFGFCLYLCDRDDLFCIAKETDRVLKSPGWLIILDFFSPIPSSRLYHHNLSVTTHKMDYRKLFDWNTDYICMTHKVRHHNSDEYTDNIQNWVGLSILRKGRFLW